MAGLAELVWPLVLLQVAHSNLGIFDASGLMELFSQGGNLQRFFLLPDSVEL